MTQGGPLDSTNVLVYAIYKNAFEYFNVGKASAIAYVLFTVILVLTLIQWNFRKNSYIMKQISGMFFHKVRMSDQKFFHYIVNIFSDIFCSHIK